MTVTAALLLLGLRLAGHSIEARFGYDTNDLSGSPPHPVANPVPYGSYGLYLARLPSKLGNGR